METQTKRRIPLTRHFITASSAILGVTLAGIAAFGGTYALWQDDEPLNASAVASGTLELRVNGVTGLKLPAATKMLPGDRVNTPISLATSGHVDTTLAATASVSGAHIVRVAMGSCPAAGVAVSGPALGSMPRALGAFTPGVAQAACLQVELPTTAPANAPSNSTAFTVSFVATQVTN